MRRLAFAALLAGAAWLPAAAPLPATAQTAADPNALPADQFVLRPTLQPGQVVTALASPGDAADDSATALPQLPSVPDDATVAALPDASDDATATGRVARQPSDQTAQPADGQATGSIPPRAKPPALDPYAPIGVRSGGFLLYPSLTVTFGDSSNAADAAGGTASAYAILAPELSAQSDWDRNAATLDLRGSFRRAFDGTIADQPEVDADGTARLDVNQNWTIPLTASYSYKTQSISDPDFPAGVDKPPGVHDLKGTVAFDRSGPLIVQVATSADHTIYENGTSGGSIVDQSDRANTLFGGRLRLGYELTPTLAPFVEAEADRRQFDRTIDDDGLRRSGYQQFYRAGISLDESPILTGDIAVGYGLATFDDASLGSIHALTADGNLVWAPTVLTTLTANATTTFSPGTTVLSSGSVVYDGSLDLAYAWRPNVSVDATGSIQNERFQGTGEVDTDSKAGLAATWKANPALWFTAGYDHEWLRSTDGSRDFTADEVLVSVKAQQ